MLKRNINDGGDQEPIHSAPKRTRLAHKNSQAPISNASKKKLKHEDYTIGWICPLEVEQTAAWEMLDEEHEPLPQHRSDDNAYTLGSIGGHNVVIAGLPKPGNNSAATVVAQMRTTFEELRFGLLVGIGGGVPTMTDSGIIRLGDVVVSKPTGCTLGSSTIRPRQVGSGRV